MLTPEAAAEIPDWNARKLAQWENVRPEVESFAPEEIVSEDGEVQVVEAPPPIVHGIRGLQLARHGEGKSTFMLTMSRGNFYESILFGQLPQIHRVPKNPSASARRDRPEHWREATEDEKPRDKKRIDLTDEQIDAVLAVWVKGITALTLAFVESVWRADGKEYVR